MRRNSWKGGRNKKRRFINLIRCSMCIKNKLAQSWRIKRNSSFLFVSLRTRHDHELHSPLPGPLKQSFTVHFKLLSVKGHFDERYARKVPTHKRCRRSAANFYRMRLAKFPQSNEKWAEAESTSRFFVNPLRKENYFFCEMKNSFKANRNGISK